MHACRVHRTTGTQTHCDELGMLQFSRHGSRQTVPRQKSAEQLARQLLLGLKWKPLRAGGMLLEQLPVQQKLWHCSSRLNSARQLLRQLLPRLSNRY